MMIAFARILFALLAFFEVLNYVSVLHFTLVYTWLGLIITVIGIWALMEMTHRKRARGCRRGHAQALSGYPALR
jgi:hypothetical protein